MSKFEAEAFQFLCPQASPVTLPKDLGFAEASGSMMSLLRALRTASPDEVVAGVSLSREGLAYAVIVRRR